MRRQLEDCVQNHALCALVKDHKLPTRLLQVGKTGSSVLKLRQSLSGECGKYATLSYCWGGDQQFKATVENLSDLYKGIEMKSLPPTIHDAVLVTRAIGLG